MLAQLGSRLRAARLERKVTAVELAKRLGISRTTLYAAEAGDPSTTMGTYVRILGALGLVSDLALVASPPSKRFSSAFGSGHASQDLQSLMLHREAVNLLKHDPSMAKRALDTLQRWRTTGDPRTFKLLDEWERIIQGVHWNEALEESERGNQLRQASPLTTLLPTETRLRIIAEVKRLKEGARHHAPA